MRGKKLWLSVCFAVFASALSVGQTTPQASQPGQANPPTTANPGNPAAPGTAAQSSTPQNNATSNNASNLSAADKKFLTEAAQAGVAEIQLGQLATQKASSDDVKKFGQRMVDEHGKLNQQLAQVASAQGVTLNQQPDPGDQMLKDNLSSLSGKAFDKAYLDIMLKDHDDDVAAFIHETQIGSNASVTALAKSSVPNLDSHLGDVRNLIKNENAPAQPASPMGQQSPASPGQPSSTPPTQQ